MNGNNNWLANTVFICFLIKPNYPGKKNQDMVKACWVLHGQKGPTYLLFVTKYDNVYSKLLLDTWNNITLTFLNDFKNIDQPGEIFIGTS